MNNSLILRKESKRYPGLFTKKYKNKVFYNNLWNEELIECRGHVELADGTIVINPFTKIFNRNENGTDIPPNELCVVSCKINGFMAAATYVKQVDSVVVSTTGSLDSDFVAMAEEFLNGDIKDTIRNNYKGISLMFEICHPDDKHIVPEVPGAYLLGARPVNEDRPYFSTASSERSLDFIAEKLDVFRPIWFCAKFRSVAEISKSHKGEGFVVYGQESTTVLKLKTKWYLVNKAIARIKDLSKLNKSRIEEEFYPLIDHINSDIIYFKSLNEQEKLKYIRKYYE